MAALRKANLTGANLRGKDLRWAILTGATLYGTDLTGANLSAASMRGANLAGAIMPDGRVWEEYKQDHLVGICDAEEVYSRAVQAWGSHCWEECPMHAALGIKELEDIGDAKKRLLVGCWVALYDAGLLPRPSTNFKEVH